MIAMLLMMKNICTYPQCNTSLSQPEPDLCPCSCVLWLWALWNILHFLHGVSCSSYPSLVCVPPVSSMWRWALPTLWLTAEHTLCILGLLFVCGATRPIISLQSIQKHSVIAEDEGFIFLQAASEVIVIIFYILNLLSFFFFFHFKVLIICCW